jgi:hypothetical protein
MNRNLLCGAALAALFSVSAGAQTCAAPDTSWHPDAAGSPDLPGSTCGHETGILSTCDGGNGAPGAAYVAQVVIAAAPNGSFTTISLVDDSGGTFHGILAAVNTTVGCVTGAGDTGHCTTSGDTTFPVQHANLSPGTYNLIVTGNDLDAAGVCGAFHLHADGTLPVTLQNFTVS